jgi:hypothetical protein
LNPRPVDFSTDIMLLDSRALFLTIPYGFAWYLASFVQKLFTTSNLLIRNLNRNPGGLLLEHIAPSREVKPGISSQEIDEIVRPTLRMRSVTLITATEAGVKNLQEPRKRHPRNWSPRETP